MEAALDTFRPSTLGWLRGTLAGWGTVLLALAGILVTLMGYGTWWLGLTALASLIVVWKWFQNVAAKYEVTEERLIVRRGIVNKSIDEIELYRIKDVRIDFTLVNQMAGIGRISVSSSDETTRGGDFVMRDIERAQERREQLRRLVDTARQKRSVREIDMVHEDAP
ncbi:MAG: PH domain-containing protein [Alphaproteobacteria bacterium]|nr:MAG: PH domain-containing protein [Alphaproteobacteria bacterium]